MPKTGELGLARSRESGAAATKPPGPPSRATEEETTASCAPAPPQTGDLTKGAAPTLGTASVKGPEGRASCWPSPPMTTGSAASACVEGEDTTDGGPSCPEAPPPSADLDTRKLSTGLAAPTLSHDNLGGAENAPKEPS